MAGRRREHECERIYLTLKICAYEVLPSPPSSLAPAAAASSDAASSPPALTAPAAAPATSNPSAAIISANRPVANCVMRTETITMKSVSTTTTP